MGGKGGGLLEGRGQGGRGKGKRAIVLVVRERMRKTPAVQSCRALPMSRCAGPPWPRVYCPNSYTHRKLTVSS